MKSFFYDITVTSEFGKDISENSYTVGPNTTQYILHGASCFRKMFEIFIFMVHIFQNFTRNLLNFQGFCGMFLFVVISCCVSKCILVAHFRAFITTFHPF